MYLYLLRFKDKPHFKFGLSKEVNRLRRIHHSYEIDFDLSAYVWASELLIREAETHIKNMPLQKVSDYGTKNGASEIRYSSDLSLVVEYLVGIGLIPKYLRESNTIKKEIHKKHKQRPLNITKNKNI